MFLCRFMLWYNVSRRFFILFLCFLSSIYFEKSSFTQFKIQIGKEQMVKRSLPTLGTELPFPQAINVLRFLRGGFSHLQYTCCCDFKDEDATVILVSQDSY
jgi:hypothetical protein